MKKPERPPSYGVLFHELTHLLVSDSGWHLSESAAFLDLERSANPGKKHIEADSTFYRKLRRGTLTKEDVIKWTSEHFPSVPMVDRMADIQDSPQEVSGEWLKLKHFITGVRQGHAEGEIQTYFDYLLALCDIDRTLLTRGAENAYEISSLSNEGFDWLLLEPSATDSNRVVVEYRIARVLQWTALLELYLRISKPEISDMLDNGPRRTMLDPFLPRLNAKQKLRCSTALYMENLMRKWRPDGCKSVDFYREIVCARSNASKLDPDISSILQADKRLRNGEKALTIEWVEENVGKLRLLDTGEDFDLCLYLIPFINMLDHVQRQSLKEGISEDLVVELFSRYHYHQKAVKNRYEAFKRTGLVLSSDEQTCSHVIKH